MSENTGYESHWPPRPVKGVKEGRVVEFPEAGTGRILTGTVIAVTKTTVLIELENGAYTWAWVHELSEKENDE